MNNFGMSLGSYLDVYVIDNFKLNKFIPLIQLNCLKIEMFAVVYRGFYFLRVKYFSDALKVET